MNDHSSSEYTPFTAFLLRLYWIATGHLAIIISAIYIWRRNLYTSLIGNILYFSILSSILICRYCDIRFYKGETSNGKPATMATMRSFAFKTTGIYLLLWIIILITAQFIHV